MNTTESCCDVFEQDFGTTISTPYQFSNYPMYNKKESIKYYSSTIMDSERNSSDEISSTMTDLMKEVLDKVSYNCKIINKEDILYFLINHSQIVAEILNAPDVIFKYFDKTTTKLNLELCYDPENEEDEGELFLNIETCLDVKTAHERLNKIDEDWFLNINEENILFFNINLNFV